MPDDTKRGPGRPTKLDELAAEKILQALRSGAYRKTAAIFAGVSPRTLREWLSAGKEEPTSPYGDFRRKVERAEAEAEIYVGAVAFKAASKDPKYALQFLSIRWRERWNTKHQVTVKGDARHPLRVQHEYDLSRLTDEELAHFETLAKRAAAPEPGGDSEGEGET